MAGKRGARAPRLLRRARQHRGNRGLSQPGDATLVQGASAPQPAHPPQLEAHVPSRNPVAAACPRVASLLLCALRRPHPRQEPSAVVPHAGICAGAARKGGPYRDYALVIHELGCLLGGQSLLCRAEMSISSQCCVVSSRLPRGFLDSLELLSRGWFGVRIPWRAPRDVGERGQGRGKARRGGTHRADRKVCRARTQASGGPAPQAPSPARPPDGARSGAQARGGREARRATRGLGVRRRLSGE
jgi:hypothetical protein